MNINTNTEVWKDVVGYEGSYKVSESGKILKLKNNRVLKPHHHGKGYLRVNLKDKFGQKKFYVHRIVGFAFLNQPISIKHNQINHIDGDKKNNHYSNLEWVSASENIQHAFKTGLVDYHVLTTEKDKEVMCYLYKNTHLSQAEVADIFNVSQAIVSLSLKKYN